MTVNTVYSGLMLNTALDPICCCHCFSNGELHLSSFHWDIVKLLSNYLTIFSSWLKHLIMDCLKTILFSERDPQINPHRKSSHIEVIWSSFSQNLSSARLNVLKAVLTMTVETFTFDWVLYSDDTVNFQMLLNSQEIIPDYCQNVFFPYNLQFICSVFAQ